MAKPREAGSAAAKSPGGGVSKTRQRGSQGSQRKNSDAERARLRRNQRNSRARRAAYVSELEARWSQCVQIGAEATSEMQQEARRVHEENKALRQLLKERGVDDEAVNEAVKAAMAKLPADKVQKGKACQNDQPIVADGSSADGVEESHLPKTTLEPMQTSQSQRVPRVAYAAPGADVQNWINTAYSAGFDGNAEASCANGRVPSSEIVKTLKYRVDGERGPLEIVGLTLPGLDFRTSSWTDVDYGGVATSPPATSSFPPASGQWDRSVFHYHLSDDRV